MKRLNYLFVFAIIFAAYSFSSCKSKTKEVDPIPATTTVADSGVLSTPAPVVIASDEELKKGVTDAVKDYPAVKAEVVDSVINLTGEIKRADWQKLNPTLNSLRPKRVNSSNLTIK